MGNGCDRLPEDKWETLETETIGVLHLENELARVCRVACDGRLRAVLESEGLRSRSHSERHDDWPIRRLIQNFNEGISAIGEGLRDTKPCSGWEHLSVELDARIAST